MVGKKRPCAYLIIIIYMRFPQQDMQFKEMHLQKIEKCIVTIGMETEILL